MHSTIFQKISLPSIGIAGFAIFATFFAFTYSIPGWVEDFAAGYIEAEAEAEERLDNMIDGIRPPESDSALARLAQSMYEKNEAQIEQLKRNLKNEAHEQWAAALALIRDLGCQCRQKDTELFEQEFQTDIALLQAANDRIVNIIHSTYMDVTADLKRDIRIFTANNAAVFFSC